MDDPAVKAKFDKAVEKRIEFLVDNGDLPPFRNPGIKNPLFKKTNNLARDLDNLMQEVIEARDFIPEYESLVFPNSDPSTAKFQRVAVASLKRGHIIPLVQTIPAANGDPVDIMSGFDAFYTVVSVSSGTVELLLVADYQAPSTITGIELANRATFTKIDDDRSVLVLSSCSIESQFLPASVVEEMTKFSITPSAPPDGCDRHGVSSASSSNVLSNSSVKALTREASLAPIKRALHNDLSLLANVVGPLGDLSSRVALNNLRNLQSSSRLHNLPFWSITEHLEAFLGFRWSDQPYINAVKKTYDSCHLSLFLPFDPYGNYNSFRHANDLITAITNLEFACVELFQEREDRPFFASIFVPLQRLLSCTGVINSIQSLNIDFLVWKFSKILVQWALLYTDESKALANATFAAFLESNHHILSFRAVDFKDEFARVDMKFLPRQGGGRFNGGFGLNKSAPTPSSHHTSFSEGKVPFQKRRAQTEAFPGPRAPKSPKTSSAAPLKAPSPAPFKGKYICTGDLLNKVDPSEYPVCKKSAEECNQRHIARPAALLPKDREELLTSITRMQGINTTRKAQMCATINAMP